jgi:fructokinase
MGHIPVSVIEGDEFAGSCPFHGTCLEGMASGKALEDRLGAPAVDLMGESQDRALSLLAGDLGQGLRAMAYTFAPERVVIGGGVSEMPGFFAAVRTGFLTGLGGYLRLPEYSEPGYLSPAALSGRSGLMGGLIIAEGGL